MRHLHNLILNVLLWWNRGKSPPRLKKWLDLEMRKEEIVRAVENENFPSELLAYISTAWGIDSKYFENADWEMVIEAFYQCILKSPQISLPITTPSHEQFKEEAWDYSSRTWHLYSHLLAKSYGWTLEYISCLQVSEALAKIQEIVVDDQLEKEFYYGLSEMAYAYDKNTKKRKFVPLPRPSWMRPRIEPEKIRKFKIPASMLPQGVIIVDGVLPEELMPKEIH